MFFFFIKKGTNSDCSSLEQINFVNYFDITKKPEKVTFCNVIIWRLSIPFKDNLIMWQNNETMSKEGA